MPVVIAAAAYAEDAEAVEPPSKFAITLTELEADARTDRADLIEMVTDEIEPPPDPRGQEPDRGWFASGG